LFFDPAKEKGKEKAGKYFTLWRILTERGLWKETELRLLSRSIFVIDQSDIIRYIEVVPEITNEPNYDKALAEARKLRGFIQDISERSWDPYFE